MPNFNIAFALPQLPNEQSKRPGGFRAKGESAARYVIGFAPAIPWPLGVYW